MPQLHSVNQVTAQPIATLLLSLNYGNLYQHLTVIPFSACKKVGGGSDTYLFLKTLSTMLVFNYDDIVMSLSYIIVILILFTYFVYYCLD